MADGADPRAAERDGAEAMLSRGVEPEYLAVVDPDTFTPPTTSPAPPSPSSPPDRGRRPTHRQPTHPAM